MSFIISNLEKKRKSPKKNPTAQKSLVKIWYKNCNLFLSISFYVDLFHIIGIPAFFNIVIIVIIYVISYSLTS